MSESTQRRRICQALRCLDARPIENKLGSGTPDVNIATGWIELKWLRKWPVRPETCVRIDHFTKQQRIWLKRRWSVNQSSWVILQVQKEWMLFEGHVAAEWLGRENRENTIARARRYWPNGLNEQELIECLTI